MWMRKANIHLIILSDTKNHKNIKIGLKQKEQQKHQNYLKGLEEEK